MVAIDSRERYLQLTSRRPLLDPSLLAVVANRPNPQSMSLPFRFASVDDYLDQTIIQLQRESPKFQHLNIGKFYLKGSDLEEHQIVLLLAHARENSQLKELSLCGITLEDTAPLLPVLSPPPRAWKKVAFNCCRGRGITSLAAPSLIESIRISNCQMNQADLEAVGVNLQLNRTLKQLELFEEDLRGQDTLNALAHGLAITQSLRLLEFSYCRFDDASVQALAKGLRQNQSLETFLCPGCELEDGQFSVLIESLSHHPNLRRIKVFRNHCGAQGATAVAAWLGDQEMASPLEHLDLSYQQFERAKKLDIALVSASLTFNTSLKSVSLSFNKLNDADAELLAVGLRENKGLRELDLRANNIRDAGTKAIAQNLVAQGSLKKLFLFGNPIGSMGSKALLQAIRRNLDMEILNMDYHTSDYDGIQFWTCLNRAGRHIMKDNQFHAALLPQVLARAKKISDTSRGTCSHADTIFHLIQGTALFS